MSRRDQHPAGVVKRSLVIAGHSTSVSLEEAFWMALRDIATTRGSSVARLVGQIDSTRAGSNLSSAIRVFVLQDALQRAATTSLTPADPAASPCRPGGA